MTEEVELKKLTLLQALAAVERAVTLAEIRAGLAELGVVTDEETLIFAAGVSGADGRHPARSVVAGCDVRVSLLETGAAGVLAVSYGAQVTTPARVRSAIAAAADALRAEGHVIWVEEYDAAGKWVIEIFYRREEGAPDGARTASDGVQVQSVNSGKKRR